MEIVFGKGGKSLLVRGQVRIVPRADGLELHAIEQAQGDPQMQLAGTSTGAKRGRKPGGKNSPAVVPATAFPHGDNEADQAAS